MNAMRFMSESYRVIETARETGDRRAVNLDRLRCGNRSDDRRASRASARPHDAGRKARTIDPVGFGPARVFCRGGPRWIGSLYKRRSGDERAPARPAGQIAAQDSNALRPG